MLSVTSSGMPRNLLYSSITSSMLFPSSLMDCLRFIFFGAAQLGHFAAFAEGEEAGCGVGQELGTSVCDVEIAHGELADAVARGEGGFGLFHAEALGMECEVGRLRVEDGVVVAAAQLKRDFAGDRFGDPALDRKSVV